MFKMVTVTVTLWPMVTGPVGETEMLVTTILGFTVTGIVTIRARKPLIAVTVRLNVATLEQLTVRVDVTEVPRVTVVGFRLA